MRAFKARVRACEAREYLGFQCFRRSAPLRASQQKKKKKKKKKTTVSQSICSEDCLFILDTAPIPIQLKIKEVLHIHWEKPTLKQTNFSC